VLEKKVIHCGQLSDCAADNSKVRLFFQDEASFGRISDPYYCWCPQGVRPVVPRQKIREYREIFGAVEPETGDIVYMIDHKEKPKKKKMGRPKKGETADSKKPKTVEKGSKTRVMNIFLQMLSDKYPNDHIVCVLDNAWIHRSQYSVVPKNITLVFIPPATPEMNPKEQVWREIRTKGFNNRYFHTIDEVVDNLHSTIANLSPEKIKSITQRDWVKECIKLIS